MPPTRPTAASFRRAVALALTTLTAVGACTPRGRASAPGSPSTAPTTASADAAAPVTLRLLHFNDVYEIGPTEGGRVGGLARVASVRQALARDSALVLTTLGGDYLSPSAIGTAVVNGTRLAGRQMVGTLDAAGLDVAVLGNHEFDVSEAAFRAHLAQARFAVLAANVTDSLGAPFAGLRPSLVVERVVQGRRVRLGLVGVVLPANPQPWVRYLPVIETARREAARLRDSVDLLVALTHQSVAEDSALVRAVPAFDLVLGGHEHERYTLAAGLRRVPILKADANAHSLQVVTVRLAPNAGRPAIVSRVHDVTAAVPDDPAVAAVVRAYEDSAFAGLVAQGFRPRDTVAVLPVSLDGREATVRERSSLLTELVGAGMAREVPGADAWVFNGGSIRLDDVVPAGVLTEYDVIRILPFGGPVVEARLTGAVLARALAAGVANRGTGGWLQSSVRAAPGGGWTVGGRALAPADSYTVAMPDFLVRGLERGLAFLHPDSAGVRVVARRRDVRLGFMEELRARWPRGGAVRGGAE